ncbi:MAG: glycosyltransferase family 9 protein [Thermodesulfobacteriota bacterium]
MNILIVKLSAIGDVIHTLPALAALRRRYPDAHITWVVEEAAADLLADHPDLDRVLISRRKTWIRALRRGRIAAPLREMRAFLRALRSRPYDLVIDFHGLFKSAVVVLLSGGRRKLGYDSMQEGSGLFYGEKIPEAMEKHAVDRYLDFVRYLAGNGIEPSSLTGSPEFKIAALEEGLRQWTVLLDETFARRENRISDARIGDFSGAPAPAAQRPQRQLSEREARVSSLQRSQEAQGRKMSSAQRDRDFQSPRNEHSGVIDSAESRGDGGESGGGRKSERRFVAVSPVAFWETKLWEDDKFAELGDRIQRELGVGVVLTGGEAGPLERIRARMQHAAANLGGRTTLRELAALYRAADLVVSTDSGPMHLAAAVGTPVVALFGPTDPARTGPYGPGHRIIRRDLDCSPCFRKHCSAPRCMTDISVEEVFAAVRAVLGK